MPVRPLLCHSLEGNGRTGGVLSYDAVYAMVEAIPEGRVATYGQIARLVGRPRHARQVGYALAATPPERAIPWHRVINARGEISPRCKPGYDEYQRLLLEDEGVVFDERGRISLARFQWRPRPIAGGATEEGFAL